MRYINLDSCTGRLSYFASRSLEFNRLGVGDTAEIGAPGNCNRINTSRGGGSFPSLQHIVSGKLQIATIGVPATRAGRYVEPSASRQEGKGGKWP